MSEFNFDEAGQLIFCINFQDLNSLLMLKPAIALAESVNLPLRFLPLVGEPAVSSRQPGPEDDSEMARYKAHRQLIRRQYAEMDQQRNAAQLGLSAADVQRIADASLASIGLIWMWQYGAGAEQYYVRRVFDAHYSKHRDIELREVINLLLEEAGASIRGFGEFQGGEGQLQLDSLQKQFLDSGLYTAPALFVGGEWYIGREHLPLIYWKLKGEVGTAPV